MRYFVRNFWAIQCFLALLHVHEWGTVFSRSAPSSFHYQKCGRGAPINFFRKWGGRRTFVKMRVLGVFLRVFWTCNDSKRHFLLASSALTKHRFFCLAVTRAKQERSRGSSMTTFCRRTRTRCSCTPLTFCSFGVGRPQE